jgi:threonine/homoserine/homoserine lactone efflux protein
MQDMTAFLTTGTVLGLSAGFAPGPLLALVVAETLQHGIKAGVKVALVPILTDLPVILFSLFILARLAAFQHILGGISIAGACFIFYMGIENLRTKGLDLPGSSSRPRSMQRGVIANVLSPYPYLFWLSVGGPTTIKAAAVGLPAAVSFIASFYLFLVGSKVVLALLVGKSRSFLQGRTYILSMRILGLILLILAGFLLKDGLRLLGLF